VALLPWCRRVGSSHGPRNVVSPGLSVVNLWLICGLSGHRGTKSSIYGFSSSIQLLGYPDGFRKPLFRWNCGGSTIPALISGDFSRDFDLSETLGPWSPKTKVVQKRDFSSEWVESLATPCLGWLKTSKNHHSPSKMGQNDARISWSNHVKPTISVFCWKPKKSGWKPNHQFFFFKYMYRYLHPNDCLFGPNGSMLPMIHENSTNPSPVTL
jgi:hypothetical protein